MVLYAVNYVSLSNGVACNESFFVVESCCLYSESVFAIEITLSVTNQHSLLKLRCPQ